ncbi:MAG: hypothetical protein HQL08_08725 [Nitrospirae bacterium]|nr:hypothetical protein [Nitrospirota bacterium]
MKRISILILWFLALPAVSHAAFMGGQFALPIEGSLRFSSMINTDFSYVVGNPGFNTLLKIAFMFNLLWVMIRFGTGNHTVWKEFAVYMLTIILVSWPIFSGKASVMLLADAADYFVGSVVTSLGGLNFKTAGSGVSLTLATWQAEQAADTYNKTAVADFKQNCYAVASAKYSEANKGATRPGPTDSVLSAYYSQYYMSDGTTLCSTAMSDIESSLGTTAQTHFNMTMAQMTQNGIDNSKIATSQNAISTAFTTSTAETDMFRRLVDNSPTPGQLENDDQPWTMSNFAQGILSGRATAMALPRAMIVLIGQTTLYIFEYYIANVVCIIKLFAGMGIAFGLIYYMFMQTLEPMTGALGIWIFGDALYIVAAVCTNNFYNQINTNMANVAGTVVGIKSNFNDALFSIAFIGVMSTVLAGVLTFKGISGISMHFMGHMSPSNFTSIRGAGKK